MTVTVRTTSHGDAIPADFSGLSFETGAERPGNAHVAGYLFSPTNTQLVTLFQNLGIASLRMGGGSVDDETPPGLGADGYTGISQLFGFAQAAGVKVIYSLRLLDPAAQPIADLPAKDAAIAGYIWRYRPELAAFAIGNEPDWRSYHRTDPRITDYPTYLADWRRFAAAILAAVPGARFVGPDTGAYTTATYDQGQSWTQRFAHDEQGAGILLEATQHDYVGGSPGATTAGQAIEDMLSPEWVSGTAVARGPAGPDTYTPYPWLYAHNLAPVVATGLGYRLTEANDYVGGVAGASDSFASALWALDYMHWWAEHGAAGVNFHNKQWILTDTIVPDPNPCAALCGNWQTAPKGYGIKAFSLGGHGWVEPLAMRNPSGVNITAYAVGQAGDLWVTIINKTHGAGAQAVRVRIEPQGLAGASAAEMVLTDGQPGDAALTTATLGGASIGNSGRWRGQWSPLPPERKGAVTVTVAATTAAVVRLQPAGVDAGPVAENADGTLALFGLAASGGVRYDAQGGATAAELAPAGWRGWAALPAGAAALGPPTTARNLDGTLQVFAPSAAGAVFTDRQATPGGAWGAWRNLGGGGLTDLSATSAADGSLSVFGLGPSGGVWVDSESAPGIGWSGWTLLGSARLRAGFSVARNLDGLLEVCGVDAGGQIRCVAQTDPGAWGRWAAVAGPRLAAPVTLARDVDGDLQVFGVAADGTLWTNRQRAPGGAWAGWHALRGHALVPGLAVDCDRQGRLVVFGVAAGGGQGVWSIRQRSPGGAWGHWTRMGGSEVQAGLVVASSSDGALQLFGAGAGGALWTDWQEPSGWSGWTRFGAAGVSIGFAPSAGPSS